VLTGGGDAPGLNAVIRAIVKTAVRSGIACIGLEDSFDGLARPARARQLSLSDVAGIHRLGGTILGTTNHGSPLGKAGPATADGEAYATACLNGFRSLGLDGLIAIGGDGTLAIAYVLSRRGMPIIGIPKTIDNDIAETAMSFGFDSAVAFATDAIDRLHATADAHHRIMVVEVMGRYTGWIALHAALGGGADVVLLPEIPFHFDSIACRLREREHVGARCSIIVAAEGAYPVGGARSVMAPSSGEHLERLGGVGERVAVTIEQAMGREARFDVLGHLQRGGSPSSVDRVLASRFGVNAVELARDAQYGVMVALRATELAAVPLERVVGRTRPVPLDSDLIHAARAMGMTFGD
jgi:6-phosphofructokinase 1